MAADRPPDGYALLEQAAQRQRHEAEAVKHLTAARSRLILGRDARSVFFAVLALRLKVIPDWDCETLETDGVSLKYNPAFVCGLSPDERLGVLVHEVLHTALAHPHRRGPRDPVQWNDPRRRRVRAPRRAADARRRGVLASRQRAIGRRVLRPARRPPTERTAGPGRDIAERTHTELRPVRSGRVRVRP
jgi:hypothetical protein